MSRSISQVLRRPQLTPLVLPLWLGLCLLSGCHQTPPSTPLPASHSAVTGIFGQVVDTGGKPVEGAYVYAYRKPDRALRGPADFEARVQGDGSYFLDLVEGRYHLVARWRRSGADMGPPRPGDAWALPPQNPVSVSAAETTRVDFVLQRISEPRLMREGTLTGGDTGFTGRLVGPKGRPVAGAFVVAYPEADFKGMPAATSPAVGDDGRFTLYVSHPGQWCLAARSRSRGQPVAGELVGLLGRGSTACRPVQDGQMVEVGTIAMEPYRP